MSYKLNYDGLLPDEKLEERLLFQCRKLVVATGHKGNIVFYLRQIEGKVQSRVEISFAGRRLSVIVWRSTPLESLEAAIDAAVDAIHSKQIDSCRSVNVAKNFPVDNVVSLQ
jgi:hypothetical protein